jgi:hypothetical protein
MMPMQCILCWQQGHILLARVWGVSFLGFSQSFTGNKSSWIIKRIFLAPEDNSP